MAGEALEVWFLGPFISEKRTRLNRVAIARIVGMRSLNARYKRYFPGYWQQGVFFLFTTRYPQRSTMFLRINIRIPLSRFRSFYRLSNIRMNLILESRRASRSALMNTLWFTAAFITLLSVNRIFLVRIWNKSLRKWLSYPNIDYSWPSCSKT